MRPTGSREEWAAHGAVRLTVGGEELTPSRGRVTPSRSFPVPGWPTFRRRSESSAIRPASVCTRSTSGHGGRPERERRRWRRRRGERSPRQSRRRGSGVSWTSEKSNVTRVDDHDERKETSTFAARPNYALPLELRSALSLGAEPSTVVEGTWGQGPGDSKQRLTDDEDPGENHRAMEQPLCFLQFGTLSGTESRPLDACTQICNR